MNALFEKDLTARLGPELYQVEVTWRAGTLLLDEPQSLGGGDTGPDPYTAVLAALASCTLSTLRMYADRKGWDISGITVKLNLEQTQKPALTVMSREISFATPLAKEQIERLLLIAGKCPISKMLEGEILTPTTGV